ncbi:hypothetical protein J6590_019806 [Homalodisca vitripennis]|nr:hypothetical protein J6590_019806 [Homalodisca vitripennis]
MCGTYECDCVVFQIDSNVVRGLVGGGCKQLSAMYVLTPRQRVAVFGQRSSGTCSWAGESRREREAILSPESVSLTPKTVTAGRWQQRTVCTSVEIFSLQICS